MAEEVTARSGQALRLYQIVGILALGWAAGRLPELLAARDSEEARLRALLGEAGGAAAGPAGAPAAPPAAAAGAPRASEPGALAAGADAAGPATPVPVGRRDEAFRLASAGYDALRAGDRRAAAERLAAAIALDPAAPQASAWAADLKALRRRVSLGFHALAREGAQGDAVAAAPVLGSSQTGAALGWTLDPLARRRITAFARVATGSDAAGRIDPETTEAAIGVRLDPFPRVPVHAAVERRFALGQFGRDDWSARIAGGTTARRTVGGRPVDLSVYGEGGIVGFAAADLYGGAEGRATTPLLGLERFRLEAGAGAWASGQQGFITSHRVDVGPVVRFGFGNSPVSAQLDYRLKVAGNAEPGSGLAFTIFGDF